jgi:hypothetical protein
VIAVHYTVEGNNVTLIDEKGQADRGHCGIVCLQPGETEIRIAKRMSLTKWRASDAPLNGPLKYRPLGIA